MLDVKNGKEQSPLFSRKRQATKKMVVVKRRKSSFERGIVASDDQ